MDEVDRALLDCLHADGRASVSTLARKLRIPRSTVNERLERLRTREFILGFRPILNHAKLGQPSFAYVLAAFAPGSGGQHRNIVHDLLNVNGVERVDMVSGEWDIAIRMRGASLEAIGQTIVDRLRTLPAIARTLTLPSFYTAEA